MSKTSIQWTDYSFNPWIGCRKVAPECAHCYAEQLDRNRFSKTMPGCSKESPISHWGSGPRYRTSESNWKQPLAWDRAAAKEGTRHRVFCASLSDWLDDENVPIEWLADLLALIHDTPHLDWLLLTKRPQNWLARMDAVGRLWACDGSYWETPEAIVYHSLVCPWRAGNAPKNIWIGVSAGADQAAALAIPARIHFLSCEPMLHAMDETHAARFDWIIFGGESGKQARPMNIEWMRKGVDFCAENEIACFVKQMGAKPYFPLRGNMMHRGTDEMQFRSKAKSQFILDVGEMKNFQVLADSHGGDMEEWPEDLRVREFPALPSPGNPT